MRPRSLIVLTIVTVISLAILLVLGTWQMERLHWKEALLTRITERLGEPAVSLPASDDWRQLSLDEWQYRPVEVEGRFRNDLQVRVYVLLTDSQGPFDGPGYWIVTPFEAEGGTVLVNRGFVPLERVADVPNIDGVVKVRGLVRAPEDRNMFTPDDQPQQKLFYARDPAAIVPVLGLSGEVAGFTLDATETPAGGLPQAGETRVSFPNRHLEYALTWYGLAGSLLVVYAGVLWSGLRGRSRRRPV